jgi:hypothetical protein
VDKPLHYLYRHFNADNELLYVGIAISPIARTKWHRSLSPWYPQIRTIKIDVLPDRDTALAAERAAILAEVPKYNIHHMPRAPRNQMSRQEAAVLANKAAAAKKRAETMEKLPPAVPLWRDTKPDRPTTEEISAQVGLSAKTLYSELGRRPAIKRKKGSSDD